MEVEPFHSRHYNTPSVMNKQRITHKNARFLTIGLTTDINARTSTAVLKFTIGFHHLRRSLIGSIFTIRVFQSAT